MSDLSFIEECRRMVAKVAASRLDHLTTSDRIMVCEGIASLFPRESSESCSARDHAEALRSIERQQLLLTEMLRA